MTSEKRIRCLELSIQAIGNFCRYNYENARIADSLASSAISLAVVGKHYDVEFDGEMDYDIVEKELNE